MDIEHWRNEIDQIDREILRLLNMRARLAIKVGNLKKAADLPLCDPDREKPYPSVPVTPGAHS